MVDGDGEGYREEGMEDGSKKVEGSDDEKREMEAHPYGVGEEWAAVDHTPFPS